MQKKFTAVTIILIILIAIRFFAQTLSAFWGTNWIDILIYLLIAAAYLAAFVGVMRKEKWGTITVSVIAVIDLVAALVVGGASGFGAAGMDVVLLICAFFEYRNLAKIVDPKNKYKRKRK